MCDNMRKNHLNMAENYGNTAGVFGISPNMNVADLAQVVYALKRIS